MAVHINLSFPDLTCLLLHISHSLSLWVLLAPLRLFLPLLVTRFQGCFAAHFLHLSPCTSLWHPHPAAHTHLSTLHYPSHPRQPFSMLTFIGMYRSCPSQVLNPLSTPLSLSILFPADRTDSGLEQVILVFPTLGHFLPAGGGLTGSPWQPA